LKILTAKSAIVGSGIITTWCSSFPARWVFKFPMAVVGVLMFSALVRFRTRSSEYKTRKSTILHCVVYFLFGCALGLFWFDMIEFAFEVLIGT